MRGRKIRDAPLREISCGRTARQTNAKIKYPAKMQMYDIGLRPATMPVNGRAWSEKRISPYQ